MVNPMFSMLSRYGAYTISTSGGDYWGTYKGREASNGFKFFYFLNEEEDYRISLVIHEENGNFWADINKTDGSHETLAQMVEFESIDVRTTG